MQPRTRWNAVAHRFIGDVAALEAPLNLTLALDSCRDEKSFERVFRLFARAPLGERVDTLGSLDHFTIDPQVAAHHLVYLSRLRNQLAHAWVVAATDDRATFVSLYRGRQTEVTITADEMAEAFRRLSKCSRALRRLEDTVGDADVWGRLWGFDAQ